MEQSCTDWPTLQSTEFLTFRTAAMLVLPPAVSRSATPLYSSVITCRPLNEGQAIPYSANRIAEWRRSELAGYINTLNITVTALDITTVYAAVVLSLTRNFVIVFSPSFYIKLLPTRQSEITYCNFILYMNCKLTSADPSFTSISIDKTTLQTKHRTS